MPIFITDPDVVEKLGRMIASSFDRKYWTEMQSEDNGYTVTSFLREYMVTKGLYQDNQTVRVEGNAAIYGNGGWNRFFVLGTTGEIFLSRSHASAGSVEKAKKLGISIWG